MLFIDTRSFHSKNLQAHAFPMNESGTYWISQALAHPVYRSESRPTFARLSPFLTTENKRCTVLKRRSFLYLPKIICFQCWKLSFSQAKLPFQTWSNCFHFQISLPLNLRAIFPLDQSLLGFRLSKIRFIDSRLSLVHGQRTFRIVLDKCNLANE